MKLRSLNMLPRRRRRRSSGPKRFDYDTTRKQWFSNKENVIVTMQALLDGELSEVFGLDVRVDLSGEQ